MSSQCIDFEDDGEVRSALIHDDMECALAGIQRETVLDPKEDNHEEAVITSSPRK